MLFRGDIKSSFMKLLRSLFIGGILLVIALEFFLLLREESAPLLASIRYYTQGNIMIESIDHQERDVIENKPFSRFEGEALGLDKHLDFSSLDFVHPFVRTSSIASGDFNNDGWQDIVLGDRQGILLYKNLGGRFMLQEANIPEIKDLNVIVVAFIDINNDGWQDMYLTSYGGRNFFVINDKKGFQNPKVLKTPNEGAEVTLAASFGDFNRDGYPDFINGNGFSLNGWRVPYKIRVPLSATNAVVINKELDFKEYKLSEAVGETLSVLLSDFTNDHNPDLIIGNDFDAPDIFYTGNAMGVFNKILSEEGIVPISVRDHMGIDVADFNNDLYMDIYLANLSLPDFLGESSGYAYCFEINNNKEKQKCENNLRISQIVSQEDIEKCDVLENNKDKNDCVVMTILRLSVFYRDESLCDKIPTDYKMYLDMCRKHFDYRSKIKKIKEDIGQKVFGNVLLQGSKEGVFRDVSKETSSEEGGWSWNAKFADLDNDEWQDIYVATGRFEVYPAHSNVFLHNQKGQFFETAHEKFNLENSNMVVAYTYIDIDNDGDLDIVSAGLNGPINAYINNETQNNSITFEFRDNVGNHFGIGNKIYIYYGDNNERHQVRQIKSGGGFLSFDSPIAHFGLGKYEAVTKIEIVWSTGERVIIEKEFLANKNYVITRGL